MLMKKFVILFIFFSIIQNKLFAQCQFILDNYTHVNCYSENTGSIDISFTDPNISFWWTGPNGFVSNSTNLSSLFAGNYILTIVSNLIPGDTSSQELCSNRDIYGNPLDTIIIEETFDISAEFMLSGLCNIMDSVDVITNIFGGTPPYFTLWSNGDTSRNANNLQSNSLLPYSLNITDANGCLKTEYLKIDPRNSMKTLMSFVGVICKDDESGEARVFVSEGNPPYSFIWSNDPSLIIIDSLSSMISGLSSDNYFLEVIDNNGCITYDTVEVKSNYDICLSPFKVFSPNNDGINDIWEIKNINIYPSALVEIYSKSGKQVYRRRNYQNSIKDAFKGIDMHGNILPSATYYYIINLEERNDVFKGTLTIVR
jgi:gliding motility-associated-like protein